MKYQVYHNPDFLKRLLDTEDMSGTKAVLAATVEGDTLEDAYRLTNNIDYAWTKNPEVTSSGNSLRSTSVGDIIREVGSNKTFVVECAGHRELGRAEAAAITLLKETS